MSIRTVIVDDEELARRGLRALLARAADVEIVAECRNGREAIDSITRCAPDLVFLDIQMPGRTGFDVIAQIAELSCPYVVFVTAFDRFALQAFDVNALDYLLKPVNEERLYAALSRARTALSGLRGEALMGRYLRLAADLRQPRMANSTLSALDRLPVKVNGRIVVVRTADIDWIEADGDYVLLHVGDRKWILRETIASVETRVALSGFVRIHRSVLVNVERVRELRPRPKGEFDVVLRDGQQLKMTRNYRAALEQLTGLNP